MYLTTSQWAKKHSVDIKQVDRWITNGHLKYVRQGGKRLVREDAPCPNLDMPPGYVTVSAYCRLMRLPYDVVSRFIEAGELPSLSRCTKERWIPLATKFEKARLRKESGQEVDKWELVG